jgi:hypothetical protein
MRITIIFVVSALLVSPLVFSGSTGKKDSENQSTQFPPRDLSDMFYTKTVAPTPEKQPVPSPKPLPPSTKAHVGFKYRILLCGSNCDLKKVDSSHAFSQGDKIRFEFESNVDGYLYVVDKQSSGVEKLLFPHPDINGGSNKIERGINYPVPATSWFRFEGVPGEERVTVIVTRTPLKSLPQQANPQEEKTVALKRVVDELNETMGSRDLSLMQELPEKGPVVGPADQPISAQPTQSVIVVNTSQDPKSNTAVIKEIILKHE